MHEILGAVVEGLRLLRLRVKTRNESRRYRECFLILRRRNEFICEIGDDGFNLVVARSGFVRSKKEVVGIKQFPLSDPGLFEKIRDFVREAS